MGREPFEGSEWSERRRGAAGAYRPLRPGPPRRPPPGPGRRRRSPRAPLVLSLLLALGGVAAMASGFALDSEVDEVDEVEPGRVGGPVAELRGAHRAAVARALRAPRVLGVKREKLESIADCESHGDPRAISSDGTYRGKYQFDRGTWKSNGGSGDPAKAPELEQDLRAAALYRAAGSNPWPSCG